MIALRRNLITPNRFMTILLLMGYIVILFVGLPSYIDKFSVNTILGITAIIFTWKAGDTGKRMAAWMIAAVIFLLMYRWLPSKFILYIVMGISIFSVFETIAGSAGQAAIISLILMSPLCEYFATVFGFPIRLQLTKIAGYILHRLDNGFHTEGNTILNGTTEFSVDTACMGLHMFISSLLAGMILIGLYQQRLGKKVSFIHLAIIGGIIIILNLFSNLLRIITLVQFQVPPENKMHYAIGMACFLLYTVVPSVFVIKYIVARFGKPYDRPVINREPSVFSIRLHLGMSIVISIMIFAGKDRSINYYLATGTINAPGYKVENMPDAIVKLSSAKGLVYLKPIIGFYSSDHQPAICWKGSGYEFSKLETLNLDGQSIYTSCLEKDRDKLYTAWWYDNGKQQTISQFTWRWDSFKTNSPWVLVNVTAASKEELVNQVKEIRKINPCKTFLVPGKCSR